MKKITYIIICISACLALSSCNKWLDVKPKQYAEEEDLFSNEVGFKEALTGCYQLAAKANLYGSELALDYLECLAQRYRYNESGTLIFQDTAFYNFNTATSEERINAIWKNMYTVIANINNLLQWTDQNKHVLITPGYYEIIKGEALALRSYLYFDLLRMFGPVYKNDPMAKSIVYRTALNRDAKGLEPADVMINYIISDLIEAKDLLEQTDPLNFDRYEPSGADKLGPAIGEDEFLIFRFKRMNFLAVKALLARVYLYKGDTDNAKLYALEVVNSEKFELATDNNANYILASELIFGFHVHRLLENVTEKLLPTQRWQIDGKAFFDNLFNVAVDGEQDFRVRPGAGFEIANSTIYIMKKFDQTGLSYAVQGTMPMIRLAEMYYILSECATTLSESTSWLNQVRATRGVLQLPDFADHTTKAQNISLEYRKEFYGEGQLWYYYKRTGANASEFFNMSSILPSFTDKNYIFPVPDDEYLFGGISQ